MLKIVMEIKAGREIVVLERNERPIKQNCLSDFLSGMVNIPEEFQELFFKFIIDRQNREIMKMLLEEQEKCRKNLEKIAYIERLKADIIRNWSE